MAPMFHVRAVAMFIVERDGEQGLIHFEHYNHDVIAGSYYAALEETVRNLVLLRGESVQLLHIEMTLDLKSVR